MGTLHMSISTLLNNYLYKSLYNFAQFYVRIIKSQNSSALEIVAER